VYLLLNDRRKDVEGGDLLGGRERRSKRGKGVRQNGTQEKK